MYNKPECVRASVYSSEIIKDMTENGDGSDDLAQQASGMDRNDATLYERLGGHDSIEAVVSQFYEYVMADDLVNHYFEDTDLQRQIVHQIQFISSVTGGPVEYSGEDMRGWVLRKRSSMRSQAISIPLSRSSRSPRKIMRTC